MITDITDRRPVLSGVIITVLFTIVPGAFTFIANILSGGEFNTAPIIFIYATVIQLMLWLKVERPILTMLPFVVMLLGFIVCEIIYTVSFSMKLPGAGPSAFAFFFSSAIVTVFGSEAAGSIAGLLIYAVIVTVRKISDLIRYR